MIIGIGSDITDIRRVRRIHAKYGMRFVQRILSPEEQQAYGKRKHKTAYLAKRFAVKEAAAKALGTGMKRGVSWRQIAALNQPSGAPTLLMRGGALRRFEELGAKNAFVSISDEGDYAIAFVILSR